MPGPEHPDRVALLLARLRQGEAVVLTGDPGAGKSHTLRAVRAAAVADGRTYAPLVLGSTPGRRVPLGAFAGQTGLPPGELGSPAAVVDAFARHRSQSMLFVDDVDLLDEESLYVVGQLIGVTGLPALLAVRELDKAPDCIQRLYDGGHLHEVATTPLADDEADALMRGLLGGGLTPHARSVLCTAAQGNPLHLREIVRGSLDQGRLTETEHGWELDGAPVPSPRLSEVMGERFRGMSEAVLEEATVLALAGECPAHALDAEALAVLGRADVVEVTDCGWVRLGHPLAAEHLLARCPASVRHDLAHRAIEALRRVDASERPDAGRRADVLALEHGCALDVATLVDLADHALEALDERLAELACTALVAVAPGSVEALRVEGLTASLVGDTVRAGACLTGAAALARTETQRVSVALARARHLGLRCHDAAAALETLQGALGEVAGPEHVAELQQECLRWAAVAGQPHDAVTAPDDVQDVRAARSLVTLAVTGVVTGPLAETTVALRRLRNARPGLLALLPDGDLMVDLAEAMALSYSGDVVATRRRLTALHAEAQVDRPQSLGVWEYALGFLEFLSADAEGARELARSAVTHLAWRDSAGLLPAAQALAAASAVATGRSVEAHEVRTAVPEGAAGDPKVVTLLAWAEAWQAHAERRSDQAAQLLVETAEWLVEAQHPYLAGVVAHCAARMDRQVDEAATLLGRVAERAGGGLLHFFARHAEALRDRDLDAAEASAREASELGLCATAADTWLWLAREQGRAPGAGARSRRHLLGAGELRGEWPAMVLWQEAPDRSTLLTERELQVTRLAADRFTAKEIAALHDVSVHTVTNQLASAFRKLGVNSRGELRDLFVEG